MGRSIRNNAIAFNDIRKKGSSGGAVRPKVETIDDKFNNLNNRYASLNNQYNSLKTDYDGFKQKYEGVAGKIDSQLVDYRQSEKPAWETEQDGKDKLRAAGGFKLKANTGAMSGLSGLASGQGTGSNGLGGATRSGGLLNFI